MVYLHKPEPFEHDCQETGSIAARVPAICGIYFFSTKPETVVERIYGKPAQPLEHEAGGEMLDILAERIQKRLKAEAKT